MKFIVTLIAMLMASCAFAQTAPSAVSLKTGTGSFTGTNGNANVLFNTKANYGGFTVINSGPKPYRAVIAGPGHVWGNLTAVVTTTCGFTGGQPTGLVTLRRTSGFIVKTVGFSSSPTTIRLPIDGDYPTAADTYEVLVGNYVVPAYGSTGIPAPPGPPVSCTTTVSNAILTLYQPISL